MRNIERGFIPLFTVLLDSSDLATENLRIKKEGMVFSEEWRGVKIFHL